MRVTGIRLQILQTGKPAKVIAKEMGIPATRLCEYATGKRKPAKHHLVTMTGYWGCGIADLGCTLGPEGDVLWLEDLVS